MSTKVCRRCLEEKPSDQFWTRRVDGKTYLQVYCKPCKNIKNAPYAKAYQSGENYRDREKQNNKLRRKLPEYRGRYLLEDCRRSDRKKGLENDLNKEFVNEKLTEGCVYCCEERVERLTLDRIDNSRGHLQNNVVTACMRCNSIRGNMPMIAWLFLVPGIQAAISAGAFGDWKN